MKINCIILAGGKSSRMGTDKASIFYEGVTALEKMVKHSNAIFHETIVVSDHENHGVSNATILNDEVKNIGAIGGLGTGLKCSQTTWNFVISVDLFLTDMSRLFNALLPFISENIDAIIPTQNGKPHFLCGLYHKNSITQIRQQIEEGEYALFKLMEKLKVVYVDIDALPYSILGNFNSPADFPLFDYKLVKILAFGMVAEIFKNDKMYWMTQSTSLQELFEELTLKYPVLKNVNMKFAVNQSFEATSYIIQNEDEIALLPPFAGG